ncbi:MAG: InlB B-repeat-containing protein [Clostridia bacterium]|nr:InlB B-repeat-containing protein [Clostridia bacterium]
MKKVISVFLAVCMIMAIIPTSVGAISNEAAILQKIDELYALLGNTYFNVDRNGQCGSKSSGHGCGYCLTSEIVKTKWFKDMFGENVTTSQFPITYCYGTNLTRNAKSCAGFGAFAEWYIFRNSENSVVNTTNVGTYAFTVENINKHVKPGDLIRFNYGTKDNGYGHSGICINPTSTGVYILDCNGDAPNSEYYNCRVAKRNFVPTSNYKTFTISRVGGEVTAEPITYCSVTLNGNGGTPLKQTLNVPKGKQVTLTTPTAPSGYQFDGWYTKASGGTYVTKSSFTVSQNWELYAHWSKKSYTISYDDNGGDSGAPPSQQKTHGTAIALSSVQPYRNHYKFLGWSTNSAATVASYQPGDSFSIDADVTLYAVWQALPPRITISKSIIHLDYETNKSETITLNVTGVYDGDYYFTHSKGRGINVELYENKLTVSAKGDFFGEETIYVYMRDANDAQNDGVISVVSKNEIKVYSYGKYVDITLNANGGEVDTVTQKIPYGKHILNTEIPSRDGYVFLGWSTDKNAITPNYVVGEYATVENDATWYAIWHKTEYTVVVNRNLNGGSGAATKVEYQINLNEMEYSPYGVTIDISNEITPAKVGYIFSGWGKNSTGQGAYTNKLYLDFNSENSHNVVATWLRTKWTGDIADSFASGEGTKESPYMIETLGQLAKLSIDVANGETYEGMYFELGEHINMQNNASWIPIGYEKKAVFKGNFDGKNHSITNLKLNVVGNDEYPDYVAGLFGECEGATIKNIKIISPFVTSTQTDTSVGVLCGRAIDCDIANIYVNMNSLSSENNIQIYDGKVLYCGGIVGSCESTTINGCTVVSLKIDCDMATGVWAGGIAGILYDDSVVKNCQALSVEITGNTDSGTYTAGGIVGEIYNSTGIANDCLSDGCNISIKTDPYAWPVIGGVAACNKGKVTHCVSTDAVLKGEGMFGSYVGGITGINESGGMISNCMSANKSHTAITNSSQMETDYEKTGYIVANDKGLTPASFNYYMSTTKNTGSYTNGTGTSYTKTNIKKVSNQTRVCTPFSSIESYENGGTLWLLEEGKYPEMYNTTDFYFVTVKPTENGSVIVSQDRVLRGDTIDIAIKPEIGYHLAYVYANNTLLGSLEDLSIYTDTKIRAVFEPDEQPIFTMVTDPNGSGTISVDKTEAKIGETITVTITPDEGFELDSIFVDGEKIAGNSFVVTGNNVISAEYKEKSYNVTLVQSDGGELNVNKKVAKSGEIVVITPIANEGYSVGKIFVNGTELAENYFIISCDSVIECTWVKDIPFYSVEIDESENGKIFTSHTFAQSGTTVLIDVVPDYGYELESIHLNGRKIETEEFVLEKSSVLTATFKEIVVDVVGVVFDKTTISLTEGEEDVLVAMIEPVNATNQAFAWESSNEAVATVEDGIVTAVSAGSATITVTTEDGGYSAECVVTVKAATVPVTGISLDKTSVILDFDRDWSTEITATIAPENATNKNITWRSTNTSVAEVNDGVVTAVDFGEAIIVAITDDGSFSAQCVVRVTADGVCLSSDGQKESAIYELPGVVKNVASVSYAVKTNSQRDAYIAIANKDAVLSGANYLVGSSAYIRFEPSKLYFRDGNKTVEAGDISSDETYIVSMTIDNINKVWDVVVYDENYSIVAQMEALAFRNTDVENLDSIVVFDNMGADVGALRVSDVRVEYPGISSITINKTALDLALGDEAILEVEIEPDYCEEIVEWISGNENVVKVVDNRDNTASITAVGYGTTEVEAIAHGSYGAIWTATCSVVVKPPVIGATGISLDKQNIALSIGGFEQINATVAPSNATDKSVTWSSTNEGVAMVSSTGMVVGVGTGTAVIVAKANDGNHTAFCVVTVSEPTIETPAEPEITLSGTDPLTVSLTGELSGRVIVALYNDDDSMIEVQIFNAIESKTVDFKNSGSYVKVIWVESFNSITPKCEAKVKNLK